MTDKGKGKAKQAASGDASNSSSSSKATKPSGAASSTSATSVATAPAAAGTPAAPTVPAMHTKGDWSAVWNADLGKYYFWNRKTNTTTWANPFEAEDAAAAAASTASASAVASGSVSPAQAVASGSGNNEATSKAKAASPQLVPDTTSTDGPKAGSTEATTSGPSAASFGGIDPDLAYLDPALAGRARSAGGAGAYAARFNARTGRFEGDPTKNPDRVSDVQRAKRQNQFYFDYDGWQATLAQQQEQTTLKRVGGDLEDDDAKRNRPSKKEMDAIKARNKEKKDKKQKGWLLS